MWIFPGGNSFAFTILPQRFPDLGKKDHVAAQFVIIAHSVCSPPSRSGVFILALKDEPVHFALKSLPGRLAMFLTVFLHR